MQSVIETLKAWQPHPFVDHFTVALILIGIVTDLVASVFSARLWIRYMALTLMIAGAIGAAGSNLTGGWEAERVWDAVHGAGKSVLERHAWWGDVLPWVFGALALWRLGMQFIRFIAASRPIYLLCAIVAGILIIYQGHLGAEMVYDYGVGTAMLGNSQAATPLPPSAVPSQGATAEPLPAPSLLPSPSPSLTPTPEPSLSTLAPMAPTPMPSTSPAPPAIPAPSPTPSMGASGTPVIPSPGESPSPAAKNL